MKKRGKSAGHQLLGRTEVWNNEAADSNNVTCIMPGNRNSFIAAIKNQMSSCSHLQSLASKMWLGFFLLENLFRIFG